MKYKVIWPANIKKIFYHLDKTISKKIEYKIENHLALDPINLGKPLSYRFAGKHSYKVGNYRVIYEIREQEIEILVIDIGHRKNIYDK
jgi:mRNA interferase RelE/StbE